MTNIRKIILLFALLISASSVSTPMYGVSDDEEGPWVNMRIPSILSPQDLEKIKLSRKHVNKIRKNGGFLIVVDIAAHTYILQNPNELESFKSYFSKNKHYPYALSPYSQTFSVNEDGEGGKTLIFVVNDVFRGFEPNDDPGRPKETEPKLLNESPCIIECSRLIFKKQDKTNLDMLREELRREGCLLQ